jgi:hypothetical protein
MTSTVVVNPLLPECLDGALTQEDVNPEAALAFRPNDYSYYKVFFFVLCVCVFLIELLHLFSLPLIHSIYTLHRIELVCVIIMMALCVREGIMVVCREC